MTFDKALPLLVAFVVAGAISYGLVRVFAEAARRRGADLLSTFERSDALGTGPVRGPASVTGDNLRVLGLLVRPAPDRTVEALRLTAWLAILSTAAVFIALAAPGVAGMFWTTLGTLGTVFWAYEFAAAIYHRDRGHAWRSAIIVGLLAMATAGISIAVGQPPA